MLCLLALARGLTLSTSDGPALLAGPPALLTNSTHSVAHLVGSVAAATSPSGAFASPEEKSQVAAALRMTAGSYAAQGVQQEVASKERSLESKVNATRLAIAKDDLVAKEVEQGQFASSQEAIAALRASEARSPAGTLLGDKARALETKIVAAEAEAAKELDELDKVRELTAKKTAEVASAEHALAEVRQQKAQTAKEAEMAEQIAQEKRTAAEAMGNQEADAEKKLDDLKNEAEAVQQLVVSKKQKSDATERELTDEAAAAQQAAAAAPLLKEPEAPAAPAAAPNATEANATAEPKAANATDYALVKQENEKLRLEKGELERQLEQVNAKKLEAENEKLAREKAELQHEIAAKLAAPEAEEKEAPTPAPAKEQSLRKKLAPAAGGFAGKA